MITWKQEGWRLHHLPQNRNNDVPEFTPANTFKGDANLTDKIIHDDHVDFDALQRAEQASPTAASGCFIAGKFEFDRGNFPKARGYLESGLRYDSENPTILNYLAALLVRTGNAKEAIPYAEHAVRVVPDSPDALDVLGYAQFAADHTADAIRTWKRSLELRPDPSVQQLLTKAERDATAEADYSERDKEQPFTLHYEGQQSSEELRRELMDSLESSYDDLVRELGVAPRGSIAVILYTGQAFFDVTQAPSWTGAINDGKLRIPIEGLSTVTPELGRVLKHELAHSFINSISNRQVPAMAA